MKIVSGPASQRLANEVAEKLKIELIEPYFKKFPDGECYFRFPDFDPNDDFVIIHSSHPPQHETLMQLFLLTTGLKEMGVKRIVAVIPYLAYARQDKAFLKGEVVSFSTILRLLNCVGVNELVTINVHAPWALLNAPMKTVNLDAVPEIMNFIASINRRIDYVFSPGKKGETMSRTAAQILKAKYCPVISSRDTYTGEVKVIFGEEAKLEGTDIVIIDDLISTGTTMIQIIREAKKRGASHIVAACVHGLFVSGADIQIFKAGADKIICTDTISTPYSFVKTADLISDYLRTIKNER